MKLKIYKSRKMYYKTISRFFLLSILGILFATSCSNDENLKAEDPKTFQYRIKEMRITAIPGILNIQSFQYNEKNQVIKHINSATTDKTFIYNTAGFLIEENNGIEKTTYINDANGRVIEEIKELNGNKSEKIVFSYDLSGYKTEAKYFDYDAVTATYVEEKVTNFIYNPQKQLVAEVTPQHTSNGLIVNYFAKEYEYDDRGNRIRNTQKAGTSNSFPIRTSEHKYIFDKIKPTNYSNSTLSNNNIIQDVYCTFINDGTTAVIQETTTITHTYNEAGYITKTVSSSTSGAGFTALFTLEKIN